MARSIKNLVAAILISISCYFAWTSIWPAYNVASFLKDQIEERNSLLASRAEIFKKIEDLKNESNSKYTELRRLALVLPEEKSFPELITAMESIYSQSGIILPGLQPGAVNDPGKISKISLKNSSEATYKQLLTLMSYLEKGIRIFDINSISAGLDSGGIDSQDPLLNFTLQGQFYYLNPEQSEASRPSINTVE